MNIKKNKGFTLIEIIVALAAFMIVMLAITSILLSVINYTAINKKTFNSNSISRAMFEAVNENKPTSTTPTVLNGTYNYKADNIDSVDDVKSFVKDKLFNTVTRPTAVTDPSDFTQCKDNGKSYSAGIKIIWHPVGAIAGIGYYEIETWCWDTDKGEVSEVNRKTYVSPR